MKKPSLDHKRGKPSTPSQATSSPPSEGSSASSPAAINWGTPHYSKKTKRHKIEGDFLALKISLSAPRTVMSAMAKLLHQEGGGLTLALAQSLIHGLDLVVM